MNAFISVFLATFKRGYVAIHGNELGICLGKLDDTHMVGFQGVIEILTALAITPVSLSLDLIP